MTTAKILIVDDFEEWRFRLRSFLERIPGFRVVGEACDGLQAIQMTTELRPDIVVLDIGMPVLNGIEAATRIREAAPDSRIIFVTQENDADIKTAALATGATGYLLKEEVSRELLLAIEAASGDGHYSLTPTEQENCLP